MAGKNKDDGWSDSDEDHAPAKQKGTSGGSINTSISGNQKKGPLQLEFQTVKEIRQIISKNDNLADSSQELLDSIAQCISRFALLRT